MNYYESEEQKAFFQYVEKKMLKNYPFLDKLLFAVPNAGKRKYGGIQVAEGMKTGVADILLLYPAQKADKLYHNLCIEMKFGTNKQTDSQKEFEVRVDSTGGLYQVCYSCNDAIAVLKWYLS